MDIKIEEKELEQVAGGSAFGNSCHFTWSGKEEERYEDTLAKRKDLWVECASSPSACTFCSCHKTSYCRNRWHEVFRGSESTKTMHWDFLLSPPAYANHEQKKRANNYNTE